MKNRRGVFEFAIFADGRGFAVTFRGGAGNSKCGDGAFGEQRAELLTNFHELR